MLLQHVPLPVVLPGERFGALPRVVAPGLGAVELAGLEVLVVDVPLQVRDRAKTPLAPRLLAGPRPVVIPSVMAVMVLAFHTQRLGEGGDSLELVE